jgi:hypothetical protein
MEINLALVIVCVKPSSRYASSIIVDVSESVFGLVELRGFNIKRIRIGRVAVGFGVDAKRQENSDC